MKYWTCFAAVPDKLDVIFSFFNRSGSIIVDFYIFMSRDFSGKIQDLQNALIGRIYNSKLGPFTVTASEVAGKG